MSVTIDGFVIDVAVSEEPQFTSDITNHPIEDGADVSDHMIVKPTTLVLTGIVSDTPIGLVADLRPTDDDGKLIGLPSADAYDFLRKTHKERVLSTVEVSFGTFKNMLLQTLSSPRTASTGDALQFVASFKQIEVVKNIRTPINAVPRAGKKRNLGAQPTEIDNGGGARAVDAFLKGEGLRSPWAKRP